MIEKSVKINGNQSRVTRAKLGLLVYYECMMSEWFIAVKLVVLSSIRGCFSKWRRDVIKCITLLYCNLTAASRRLVIAFSKLMMMMVMMMMILLKCWSVCGACVVVVIAMSCHGN